jgi:hypothetical protein
MLGGARKWQDIFMMTFVCSSTGYLFYEFKLDERHCSGHKMS